MHVRQLEGGCDQITGEGHSPILRAQDPMFIVEVVAEMGVAAFANRPERSQQGDDAIAEQAWVDAGRKEAKLEVHEKHRVAVVVKPWVHPQTFQALAAKEPFQNIADGLRNLRRYRIDEIALKSEGRHGGWAARG
jgi:hypothetical protein